MFFQRGEEMRKLLILLLSLILLSSAVSAIVITEVDNDSSTQPISVPAGENISISIIKDTLNETKDDLVEELREVILVETGEYEIKIDNYFYKIISKIGLGILCLTLFIFNLFLANKLLIGMVFKHG